MSSNSQKASVKAVYNQIGKEFSASRGYIWPDLKPFLAQVKPGSNVLDLGCGNGRLVDGLPSNVKYTGIDFSSTLLNSARDLHPKAKFIKADVTDPKVWNKLPEFDYIFCIAVIHHLPTHDDHLFLLKQIKKYLKPGGKCLITAWNLWQRKYLKHHLDPRSKIQDLHYLNVPFQGKPRFHFAHTAPYLKHLVREAGSDLIVEKNPRNYLLHNFPTKPRR